MTRAASKEVLKALGDAARRRLLWLRMRRRLSWWAGAVIAILLPALLIDSLFPLAASPTLILWTPAAAVLAGAAAASLLRRPSRSLALATVDLEINSGELLSTAYQEARRNSGAGFTPLLMKRAAEAAEEVDVSAALPSRRSRSSYWVLLGYLAAAALTYFPPLGPRLWGDASFRDRARFEAERLAGVEKLLKKEGLRQPAARVRKLRRALERGRLPRTDALRALDALERSLEKDKPRGLDAAAGEMARAGAALKSKTAEGLSRALRSGDAGAAAKELQALAEESKALPPKEREALERELREAAKSLAKKGPLGGARQGMKRGSKGLPKAAESFKKFGAKQKQARALGKARGICRDCRKGMGSGAPAPGSKPGGAKKGSAGAGSGPGKGPATPVPNAGENPGGPSPPGSPAKPNLDKFKRVESDGGAILAVPGNVTGRESSTPNVVKDLPNAGAAAVPYTEVLPRYRSEAEEAMKKETVPPAYRRMIRDYFHLLDPKTRPKAKSNPPAKPESM